MAAGRPALEIGEAERAIIAHIKAAKIPLRFDRVVVRLVNRLREAASGVIPDGTTMLVTLTAPIKRPDRTAAALEERMRAEMSEREHRADVCGNDIRLRRVAGVSLTMPVPRIVCFVHNRDANAAAVLDIAERWLLGRH